MPDRFAWVIAASIGIGGNAALVLTLYIWKGMIQ